MFDEDLCKKNTMDLARAALDKAVGFEIDMEGKQSVDLTISITKACAAAGMPVTLALQAYLKRTLDDLDELSSLENIRFRLVKGAYLGDTADRHMIGESYKLLTQALTFLAKPYCVATHDSELLDWMELSGVVDPCRTEFSFLKGSSGPDEASLCAEQPARLRVRSVRKGKRTLHRPALEVPARSRGTGKKSGSVIDNVYQSKGPCTVLTPYHSMPRSLDRLIESGLGKMLLTPLN